MEKAANDVQTHLETIIREVVNILTTYGMDVIGALAILIIGLWFSGRAAKMMERMLTKSRHIDATLVKFFASFVNAISD